MPAASMTDNPPPEEPLLETEASLDNLEMAEMDNPTPEDTLLDKAPSLDLEKERTENNTPILHPLLDTVASPDLEKERMENNIQIDPLFDGSAVDSVSAVDSEADAAMDRGYFKRATRLIAK